MRRLLGIAERVVGLMADYNAAQCPIRHIAQSPQQIIEIDLLVNAGDKQFLAFSFAQKVDAALQPQASPGEHDDGIGRRRR